MKICHPKFQILISTKNDKNFTKNSPEQEFHHSNFFLVQQYICIVGKYLSRLRFFRHMVVDSAEYLLFYCRTDLMYNFQFLEVLDKVCL